MVDARTVAHKLGRYAAVVEFDAFKVTSFKAPDAINLLSVMM